MEEMYNIIKEACKRNGKTVGRMCSDLSISRGVMSDLKSGRTKMLSAGNLQKIAEYCGITVSDILSAGTIYADEDDRCIVDMFKNKKPVVSNELSEEEKTLLYFWRAASEEKRKAIMTLMKGE